MNASRPKHSSNYQYLTRGRFHLYQNLSALAPCRLRYVMGNDSTHCADRLLMMLQTVLRLPQSFDTIQFFLSHIISYPLLAFWPWALSRRSDFSPSRLPISHNPDISYQTKLSKNADWFHSWQFRFELVFCRTWHIFHSDRWNVAISFKNRLLCGASCLVSSAEYLHAGRLFKPGGGSRSKRLMISMAGDVGR